MLLFISAVGHLGPHRVSHPRRDRPSSFFGVTNRSRQKLNKSRGLSQLHTVVKPAEVPSGYGWSNGPLLQISSQPPRELFEEKTKQCFKGWSLRAPRYASRLSRMKITIEICNECRRVETHQKLLLCLDWVV